MSLDPNTPPTEINAALFWNGDDHDFLAQCVANARQPGGLLVVSSDPSFGTEFAPTHRVDLAPVGLASLPLDLEAALDRIRTYLAGLGPLGCVVVDMDWALSTPLGGKPIEDWANIAERLCAKPGIAVISAYAKDHMIEEQLSAAFYAHQQFLAPSGFYENPHWLPGEVLATSTVDEQLGFMLSRVVPDFEGSTLFRNTHRLAARGAAPDWARGKQRAQRDLVHRHQRWFIYCLGPLRVYRGDGTEVDWQVPGGAAKKTKSLFAYLLSSGEKGAHADQVCELLWQNIDDEQTKRARLHHTIAILRKALGGPETVERSGDYYRLAIPSDSWTDIAGFEQVCRRALSHARHEQNDAALKLYFEADALYRGDLFEGLPHEYLVADSEDWVMPRRTWLREMAIRVQYDMSKLLRRYRRYGEALEHALKAVAIDPTNEAANAEAMRVFHAQGRTDAMHRQFRQHRAALEAMGETSQGLEIRSVYDELCRSLDRLTPNQRKTKELVLR